MQRNYIENVNLDFIQIEIQRKIRVLMFYGLSIKIINRTPVQVYNIRLLHKNNVKIYRGTLIY
jgi:hypothetical protein